MSRLDKAKEQLAYLKFWLGVMVVTDISLVGWLVSNAGEAAAHRILGALVAVIVITASGFAVHRRIERLIEALEDLQAWRFLPLSFCWLSRLRSPSWL